MTSHAQLSTDDANTLLEQHGFATRFTPEHLGRVLSEHTPHRVRDALARAANDSGAKRFVENLFAHDAQTNASSTAPLDPEASDETPVESNASPSPSEANIPLTFKVYGSKGALEFRAHTSTKAVPTVMLEGALAQGPRRFDWANKISLQVMPRELPAVAAVLGGLLAKCEFRNHGPDKNKGYSIERQKGGFFVKVFQSGEQHRLIAVPMPPEEAYFVNSLVLRQLAQITPGCDGVLVLSAIRAYAKAVENPEFS